MIKPIERQNSFLLPDELGWECNDELQELILDWAKRASNYSDLPASVVGAELIDDMYAVIKKYQNV